MERLTTAAELAPSCGRKGAANRFLVYCCERLDILQHGAGWDVEYPREVWRMSRLGYDSPANTSPSADGKAVITDNPA